MAAIERPNSSAKTLAFLASRNCTSFLCATLVALLLAIMPATSAAQTAGTGALSGTVTDASGSVIAGAQVKVTSEGSGEVRTVTTGGPGSFTVPLLLPGAYRVDVTKDGFRTATDAAL